MSTAAKAASRVRMEVWRQGRWSQRAEGQSGESWEGKRARDLPLWERALRAHEALPHTPPGEQAPLRPPPFGHPSLSKAVKATVQRILAAQPLHPEKVQYYLERRDPNFEAKMREILLVYREVALQNQGSGGLTPVIVTVSVDEKPGC
jgi:hypothetical protein